MNVSLDRSKKKLEPYPVGFVQVFNSNFHLPFLRGVYSPRKKKDTTSLDSIYFTQTTFNKSYATGSNIITLQQSIPE